ncbi:MAG: vanadium-dependent haloperoxidase [Ferruginibacter sp.]
MRQLLLSILLLNQLAYAQVNAWEKDATPLHRAQKALTEVIIHDIFSPPVASRIYAYANMAAYETLVKQNPAYHSFYQQVKTFPNIPGPTKRICASLAAVNAFLITGKGLVFSEKVMQDSINNILKWYSKKLSPKEFNTSMQYGQQVAEAVIKWAGQDKYKETRSLRRYRFLKEEGKWIPTPPVYMAAIEPYWNRIRPILIDSCNQFMAATAVPFSTDTSSVFYQQAVEVYNTGLHLPTENRAIASFWDCNPFAVTMDGHLNFAAKKISPGGHWISIAGVACRNTNADIMKSAAVYSMTAIALFDGFIICWDEKYRSNVIRPETYINKYMDESWRPLLQTPPFPEYSSGHSVVSTAAATVLTQLFGDQFAYDDNTEVDFGLPVRHFSSFTDACNEAAISRLYGGIHYRAAIEEGQKQGSSLGRWILGKIRLM